MTARSCQDPAAGFRANLLDRLLVSRGLLCGIHLTHSHRRLEVARSDRTPATSLVSNHRQARAIIGRSRAEEEERVPKGRGLTMAALRVRIASSFSPSAMWSSSDAAWSLYSLSSYKLCAGGGGITVCGAEVLWQTPMRKVGGERGKHLPWTAATSLPLTTLGWGRGATACIEGRCAGAEGRSCCCWGCSCFALLVEGLELAALLAALALKASEIFSSGIPLLFSMICFVRQGLSALGSGGRTEWHCGIEDEACSAG